MRGKVLNHKSMLCWRRLLHNWHTNCEGEASSIPYFTEYVLLFLPDDGRIELKHNVDSK